MSASKIKRVLVTGASGFLGSHISEALHDAGYEVHALIRENSSRRWLGYDWLNIHTVGLNQGADLSATLSRMYGVIHCAAKTSAHSKGDFHKVNVEATRMLADESIKAGVRRFIYISSQAAGGPSKGPYPKNEDDPDCPVSAYGRSKKDAEKELYSLRDRIEVVTLRYSIVYGPRSKEMLPVFKIAQGAIQPLLGMKPFYISMIHVEDAVRAAVAALTASVPSGSIYYITDGIDYTLEYLYDRIDEVTKHRGRRVHVPFWIVNLAAWLQHDVLKKESAFTRDKVKEFKARYWLASPERAMRELGWRPQLLPEEGFAQTVRWYRYKRWL